MDHPWLQHYDDKVPHTLTYPDMPVQGLLENTARTHPTKTATIFFGARLTYAQIAAQSDRLAVALRNLGVQQGDRVALILPNCPQFVIAYYAVLKAGGIVVPTNPLYKAREMEHQLLDAGVHTVITLNIFEPIFQEIQPAVGLQNIIVTEIKDYLPPVLGLLYPLKERREKTAVHVAPGPGIHFWDEVLRAPGRPLPPLTIRPDDLALLQYTGGTTGTSKGAMLTHRNLVANALQCRNWLRFAHRRQRGLVVRHAVLPCLRHDRGHESAVLVGAAMLLSRASSWRMCSKPSRSTGPPTSPACPPCTSPSATIPTSGNTTALDPGLHQRRRALPVEVAQTFERLTGGHRWRATA